MKLKNRKGISKILATIIIISFCLIITIFAITWISSISEKYMNANKIEITYVFSKRTFDDYFFISIEFKNVGKETVRVCNVAINGKPFKEFAPETKVDVDNVRTVEDLDPLNEKTFLPVEPGELGGIGIGIPPYAAFVSQKIHITIYTTDGGEYHVSLILEE
ncbi:MAG: DUF2393 family protein [Nitrososphaerota archaeon]